MASDDVRARSSAGAGTPAVHGGALVVGDIRARLSAAVVGCQLYLFGELSSTDRLIRRMALEGAPEGTTVLADTQTSGQGRLERGWFSPPGVNLHVSVLFRPTFHIREAGRFALIAPVALAETIRDLGLSPAIKWPNDVLVGRGKVGATRMETLARGEEVSALILGAMVNVNVEAAALRVALGPTEDATSLAAMLGRRLDRSAVAAAYLSRLDAWVRRYRDEGARQVVAAWREHDVMTGCLVRASGPRGSVEGRATGIDSSGRLVLQVAGERRVLAPGEVSVVELRKGEPGP